MFQKIIVLCTANICRSPMAEAILRAKVVGCEIYSAGTSALVGQPAALYTRQIMLAHGYDVSQHRAMQATEILLKSMDLILSIDESHLQWVNRNFPQLRGRVHKVGKWRNNIDIADPYGGPVEHFASTYELVDACIGDWAPYLRR